MNKSITQATQNDKQISKSIKRFFTRFHVSSALKASNAYKKKGVPLMEIFQHLFLLIFSNRSMYMSLLTGRNTPDFAKDTVYRFMKMPHCIQQPYCQYLDISFPMRRKKRMPQRAPSQCRTETAFP